MYILGLDISTSAIGVVVMSEDKSMKFADAISLKKQKGMIEKADVVEEYFCNLKTKFDISHVCIEQNLQAFRPGFSSASTLFKLARFNGIVSYIVHKCFNKQVNEVNVNHARKVVGLKINRKSSESTKEQVVAWVKKQDLDGFIWPTREIKRGERKGLVLLSDEAYDIADAYVVASSYAYERRNDFTKKS